MRSDRAGVKKSLATGPCGSAACCAESLRLSGKWLKPKSLILSLKVRKGLSPSAQQAAEPRGLFLRRRPGVERSDSRTLAWAVPR